MERRLCFHYNERYMMGYRCKFRQLRIMIALEEKEKKEMKTKEEEETTMEEREIELVLNSNSIVGLETQKTIKLIGALKGRKVIILLDNKTTHNFISRKLVKDLKLLTTPT